MKRPEDKIQTAFANYVSLAHPEILATIAPAGFVMSAGMAMKMVRMGYRKGTPDWIGLCPKGKYMGLLIEFKAPGGVVSPEQTDFLARAERLGYFVAVCYSTQEAISILEAYLAPQAYLQSPVRDEIESPVETIFSEH